MTKKQEPTVSLPPEDPTLMSTASLRSGGVNVSGGVTKITGNLTGPDVVGGRDTGHAKPIEVTEQEIEFQRQLEHERDIQRYYMRQLEHQRDIQRDLQRQLESQRLVFKRQHIQYILTAFIAALAMEIMLVIVATNGLISAVAGISLITIVGVFLLALLAGLRRSK